MNSDQAAFEIGESAKELAQLAESECGGAGVGADLGDGVEAVGDGSALVEGEIAQLGSARLEKGSEKLTEQTPTAY